MVEFKFPDIGEGVTEGVLLKWLVAPGDEVEEGDPLCEVETDKVTTELPSPADGVVEKCYGEVGETVVVGKVLVTIQTGDDEKVIGSQDRKEKPAEETSGQQTGGEKNIEENAGVVGALDVSDELMESSREGSASPETAMDPSKKVLATPVARKMAYDLGIDLKEVKGTGPVGRIMKADLEKMQDSQQGKMKTSEVSQMNGHSGDPVERISLSNLRKAIMKKMTQSASSIPHTTSMEEIDVSSLVEYREKVKHLFENEHNVRLTYLPFIIKALTTALREHPRFNSRLDEANQELIIINAYHIGIAVDTKEGLMVPVIRHADRKSILALQQEAESLGTAARERTIKLEQVKGSTFSITNYGSFGTSFGIPIINYPEAAILGVGRIMQKPVVQNGKVVIRWMMPLTLAFDHRIVDGGDAGRFMHDLIRGLVSPDELLLK
jgi:pyruvate dehydrogenase E2 component (dihydrolipoamide acetyltransferase)